MKSYEVEIKSLLGSKDAAESLKINLKKFFPKISLVSKEKQLNHYFNVPKDLGLFEKKIVSIIPLERREAFANILEHGNKISVRTRDANDKVILVLKASLGDDTSSNGVRRVEFEVVVPMKLDELDKMILSAGCTYQAKWSREREEFKDGDLHVCIDKNAGYGYLVEFEKVVSLDSILDKTHEELLAVMKLLNVVELPQDRLERMFAHYNAHWPEYYGTDNIFTIQ